MNSLFGVELPTAVNFVIAFVVVLLLIGAAAWLVRRFGSSHLDAAARSRLPRLAVIDSAAVDGRRKLVIIRRDNVEHLLMIGGPSDVVVETNIVRTAAAGTRDAPAARNGMDAAGRPPETQWPLQPEPVAAPTPAVRPERGPRVVADDNWQPQVQGYPQAHPQAEPAHHAPPVRAVRAADTLAGLAEELSHPGAQEAVPPQRRAEPLHAVAPQQHAQPHPAADQSLAEMAQRLEAALRRPMAQKIVADSGGRVAAVVEVKSAREAKAAAAQPNIGAKGSAQPKPQPQPQQNANLEQEMATLLNRPGKT